MTTLDDLYVYYSRQHGCLPNSGFRQQLQDMYEAAGETRNIKELSLSKNYLGPRGLRPVFDLIRNIHALERVDLAGNGLDNEGAQTLADALVKHPNVAHVDLSRNALHDGCAAQLLRLVKDNDNIVNLSLNGNNFSAGIRDKLSSLIDGNRQMHESNVKPSSAGLVPPRATPYRAILDNEYVTSAESGGSLSFEYSWRKNPQYRLALTKSSSSVRITLNVHEPTPTRLVGFTVLRTTDARKALVVDRSAAGGESEGELQQKSGISHEKPRGSNFEQKFVHDEKFVPARYVSESSYSDTSCTLELDLGASTTPCDCYLIIPHTFQPGKSFSFKLTAEVAPAIDCAVVTLEKVGDQDCWLVNEIEGAWSAETSSGGAISEYPSWRLNDMIRVCLDKERSKAEPGRMHSAATFFVLVSIQNEEETSAAAASSSSSKGKDLKLGCDVLLPESSENYPGPHRPVRGKSSSRHEPETVYFSYAHRNATTIAFAFDRRCNESDLDFFLAPSLFHPGVDKSYRIAIYSSVCIRANISVQGTDWCWRQVPETHWDVETCGGGRSDNPLTWINNPCYRFVIPAEASAPVDMLLVLTCPGPQPQDGSLTSGSGSGGGPFSCATTTEEQRRKGRSSAYDNVDFSIEIDAAESGDSCKRLFSAFDAMRGRWSKSSDKECSLWANGLIPGKEYWIVPQTRLPGIIVPFRLNIFSSGQILLLDEFSSSASSPPSLSVILRKQQLARYESMNAARRLLNQQQSSSSSSSSNSGGGSGLVNASSAATAAAGGGVEGSRSGTSLLPNNKQQEGGGGGGQPHESAIQLYGSSGEMFIDRDFPRGPSSLWLNATEKPLLSLRQSDVPDLPDVHEWSRLTEIVASPLFSPLQDDQHQSANSSDKIERGVIVQGLDDSWFFSALASVCCTKKSLAQALVQHADFSVGVFQFRFFKHGVPHLVTVDDFVPLDGAGELCFSKSKDQNDLFFPLVEKAYAKLHRCYEALDKFNTTHPAQRSSATTTTTSCDALFSSDLTEQHPGGDIRSGYASGTLISQALADLTGGLPIERCLFDRDGTAWSQSEDRFSSLWGRLLNEAHTENFVMAFRACSKTQSRGAEKCARAGLFTDRLYPVVEAMEAEGLKLVCLLNCWGWDSGVSEWKGKWSLGGNNWNEAKKSAFDVEHRPKNSFWVSYEELLYYFGYCHYVDLKTETSRTNFELACGGPPESDEWINNHQFSLNIDSSSSSQQNERHHVVVGLHEQDRRLTVNRSDVDGVVDYKPRLATRIVILEVPQNERRINCLTNTKEIRILQKSGKSGEKGRDSFFGFEAHPGRRYIIMPCFDVAAPANSTPAPPRLNCTLSASAFTYRNNNNNNNKILFGMGGTPVKTRLTRIEDDRVVSLDGEWIGATAGGPQDYPEWRSNPQFLLYPSYKKKQTASSSLHENELSEYQYNKQNQEHDDDDEENVATVTVVLRQRNPTNSSTDHIGFVILDTPQAGVARIMKFDQSTVIASAPHENSSSVSVSVKLRSISSRRGVPYVIVPSTWKPAVETGFSLQVISNKPVQIRHLPCATSSAGSVGNNTVVGGAGEFDWKVVRFANEKISVSDGSAGGSTRFSSWRNNPQYCIRFPVGKSGRLVVTMIKAKGSTLSQEQIGIMCFKGEDFQGGRRKRLAYRAEDIAGLGASSAGKSAEIDIPFENCTTSLLVMPFSELPFTEVEYTLVFHCTVDITIERALEWNQYTQEGNWTAGSTAGGPRHAHGWVNNPFFSLKVDRPTRIYALAMQYPHGPEKLMARKVGKQKVFIAPPIVNDHLAVEFGIDLCNATDDSLPVVTCSKPTRLAETSVNAILEPLEKAQHVVVPYTSTAGIEADFKILLYTDHPVDFSLMPPADQYRGRSFSAAK